MDDVSKEVKRISNLRQNKNKDKAILEKIARINVWKKQISIGKQFSDEPSKIVADEIFNSYLNNYDFDSFTDVQNVADLVSEEVLKKQIQVKINKIASDENVKNVPDKLIASLHSIEERIWILKEKVGIASDKDKDALDGLVDLENKYKVYIPFNRNEFTTCCSHCGKMLLLRRRCSKKDFETLKHPMFSGRFYYNRRAMSLVKAGILPKIIYAWIFFTSVRYVDWCLQNENKIVEINGVEESEIKSFIMDNPHLQETKIPGNILKEKK